MEEAVETGDETPPIQELLSGMGYSYAHMCRMFRQAYGIPPLKYVHMLRISRAQFLLTETDLSISEIALRLGFEDCNYFSQLF